MLSFYSTPDLNDGFGSKIGRVNPHRGLDFPHSANTPVPAWAPGVVSSIGKSSIIGNYLTIKMSDGTECGYAHLKNIIVSVGQHINLGDIVGLLAGTYDYHGSAWNGPHLHTTYGQLVTSIYTGTVWNPWPRIQAEADSNANVSSASTSTPLNLGENDMAFQVRIQENGGLGRTLFFEPGIIAHVVHDDVVRVNQYVGVPGGVMANQVSLDDARRLAEVRGFNWPTVNGLQPGQAVIRDTGAVVNAGASAW